MDYTVHEILQARILEWGAIAFSELEGVPGLPGAPQDEAGLTRKFETSHVDGATGRTPPSMPGIVYNLCNFSQNPLEISTFIIPMGKLVQRI